MKAVVLLSGGVDSTVLLAARIAGGDECVAVTFEYGQLHVREVAAAKMIARHYGVLHHIVPLDGIFASCALTGDGEIPISHAEQPDATTVPGRNLVMLSCASAIASAVDAVAVLFGANADDVAGYLDCRYSFIAPLDEASRRSHKVTITAPFCAMSKAQIIELGKELGAPLEWTWSCYRGEETPCGNCGACRSLEEATA